jgi:hypothetical protein
MSQLSPFSRFLIRKLANSLPGDEDLALLLVLVEELGEPSFAKELEESYYKSYGLPSEERESRADLAQELAGLRKIGGAFPQNSEEGIPEHLLNLIPVNLATLVTRMRELGCPWEAIEELALSLESYTSSDELVCHLETLFELEAREKGGAQ